MNDCAINNIDKLNPLSFSRCLLVYPDRSRTETENKLLCKNKNYNGFYQILLLISIQEPYINLIDLEPIDCRFTTTV